MDSEDGVMSLPLRLAISMLVVSIALPLCLQSLSDGGRELSRRTAVETAEEISRIAEELSSKPVGESRVLWAADGLRAIGPAVSIIVGSLFGEKNFASIRCTDATGWEAVMSVDLSPEIVGFCSFDLTPLTVGCDSGDLLISHRRQPSGDIIQVGPYD